MQYNYKPKSYEVGYDDAYSPQKKFMGSNPMQNKREYVELKEQGDILREGAEYGYQFLKPENFRKLLVQPKNFWKKKSNYVSNNNDGVVQMWVL